MHDASYSPPSHDPASNLDVDVDTPVAWTMPSSEFRSRVFLRSLSPARRVAIARQPRFKNQPYLRLANQPNLDDTLP